MLLRALLFCAPFCVHQTFANQTFAYSFDDDDDDGGGDNAAREYEDARLSKEIIQEIEYYQADPVMDSLSVFFCCALSPTRTGEAC